MPLQAITSRDLDLTSVLRQSLPAETLARFHDVRRCNRSQRNSGRARQTLIEHGSACMKPSHTILRTDAFEMAPEGDRWRGAIADRFARSTFHRCLVLQEQG